MNKTGLGIIGGLGDVSIGRKFVVLYKTQLGADFEVVSIADVYDASRVSDKAGVEELFSEIKSKRLKTKVDPYVEAVLKNNIGTIIDYFQIDPLNPKIPRRFFERVSVADISTPNKSHLPLILQVLYETNVHLIIEKPVVSSLEEAVELEEAVKDLDLGKRVVMDAEHYSHYGNLMEYILNFQRFCKDGNGKSGLGKVKKISISIEENEDFSSERNRQVIEVSKSGGGIGLDTGIHAVAFLRNIGAKIDSKSIQAQPYKSHDANIQDEKYAETAMEMQLGIQENEYFTQGCTAEISVGKCCAEKTKSFIVEHEHGKVVMDIAGKTLEVYKRGELVYRTSFAMDAFYNVFDNLRKGVVYGEKPFSSLEKAIANAKDIFRIRAKAKPLTKLQKGENRFSMKP